MWLKSFIFCYVNYARQIINVIMIFKLLYKYDFLHINFLYFTRIFVFGLIYCSVLLSMVWVTYFIEFYLYLYLIFFILGKLTDSKWTKLRRLGYHEKFMRSWIRQTMSWTTFFNIKRKWIFCQIGNGDMSDHYVASYVRRDVGGFENMGRRGASSNPSKVIY